MRWKRVASLLLAVLLAGSAVGCVGADGEIYGEKEVLEYVDTLCKEPYELLDSELIQQTPDNMEYHFARPTGGWNSRRTVICPRLQSMRARPPFTPRKSPVTIFGQYKSSTMMRRRQKSPPAAAVTRTQDGCI